MSNHISRLLIPARNKAVAFFVFIREWLRSPRSIGMVCPSGPVLAEALASSVPLPEIRPDGSFDLIVELGAGTGVVTQELVRRGINPQCLLIVERSKRMVDLLRLRFPGLRVVHGDACELSRFIPPQAKVVGMVSSLPLMSIPGDIRREIMAEMLAVLDDGVLVQYTYSWGRGFILMRAGFRCISSKRIWRNVPPARVLQFVNQAVESAPGLRPTFARPAAPSRAFPSATPSVPVVEHIFGSSQEPVEH